MKSYLAALQWSHLASIHAATEGVSRSLHPVPFYLIPVQVDPQPWRVQDWQQPIHIRPDKSRCWCRGRGSWPVQLALLLTVSLTLFVNPFKLLHPLLIFLAGRLQFGVDLLP